MKHRLNSKNNKKTLVNKNSNHSNKVKHLIDFKNNYLDSFRETSWNNLISVITDLGLLISFSFIYVLASFMTNVSYNSLMKIMNNITVDNPGSFLINLRMGVQFIGVIVLTVLLFILFYSVLNGIFWIKKVDKKISLKLLFKVFLKNLVLGLPFIVIIYLIYNVVKEPYWAYLNLILIALFILIIPITNIMIVNENKKSVYYSLNKSFSLFFGNFWKFSFHYFIILITAIFISFISGIFYFLPQTIETIVLVVVGLYIISWGRNYIYNFVKGLIK